MVMLRNWLILFVLTVSCLTVSPANAQGSANAVAYVLPLQTYTASTVTSPFQTNATWRGLHVVVNVSAYTGGTYTPHIQAQDPVSGTWYDLLVGSAINATGLTVLKVYPGIAASSNIAASDILPLNWQVTMVGASTPSMTFSVTAYLEH